MGTDAHWDFQSIVHIPIFKLGSVTWVGICITCHNFCKTTISQLLEKGFSGGSAGKESACNAGDLGSIPGLGRSPGKGNSYPLQYSGLENSMDSIVHGVAKNRTRLSDFHFHFCEDRIIITLVLELRTSEMF